MLQGLTRYVIFFKMLGYYQSKDHPRKSSSKALKMDLESVRPDPLTPLEEYRYAFCFCISSLPPFLYVVIATYFSWFYNLEG